MDVTLVGMVTLVSELLPFQFTTNTPQSQLLLIFLRNCRGRVKLSGSVDAV